MALSRRRTPEDDPKQPAAAPDAPATPANSAVPADWHARYEIENRAEVDAYVRRHPSVQAILSEAPGEIVAVFSVETPPRIRINIDPEAGDSWLTVGIPVADVGPGVLPLLDQFDERWWLERMPATDAVVVFDVVPR